MPKQMSGKTFSNLLSYYIACLEQEDIMSVTFKISSEGTAFLSTLFQTELLFHTNNKQVMAKNTEGIKKIFQTSLLRQKNKTLFYGYPVVIGPEGTISPLFFIEVQCEQNDDAILFTNISAQNRLNHSILSNNNFTPEEILNIQQEIEGEDFSSALESICKMLHFTDTVCSSTLDERPFKRTITPTLINKAIIYYGERTDITRALIVELSQLKRKPIDDLASSPLILFLAGEYQSKTVVQEDKPLLEIFSLNPAQENAVRHSLRNTFTVITGPPGTGKSQVVLNIIANAVYQNKTILFASKNNKAVDVITERLTRLLPFKLFVRMGNQNHRRTSKSDLELLIKQPMTKIQTQENNVHNLLNIESQIKSVQNQINSLTTLNKSLESTQNVLDSLRTQPPYSFSTQEHHLHMEMIDPLLLQEDLKKYFEKRGFIQHLNRKRAQRKQEQCFKKYYEMVPTPLKTYLQHMIVTQKTTIETALKWVLILKKEECAIDEIQKIKQTILNILPYAELKSKLTDLHTQYIAISQSLLQQHWVNAFAEADDTDRQRMITYFSTSEQLESWVGNQDVYRQLTMQRIQTLQRILPFLPVWIVTNLSAKQSFPLCSTLFDFLIIDEASQCDIASAIPLFYRAKHIVIIGDPHQLRHISRLSETQDRSLASSHHISEEFYSDVSYTKYSLYDISERIIRSHDDLPMLLNEHYRCHPDIISFSNEYYYGRKLRIETDEKKLLYHPSFPARIFWYHVKGKTIQAKSPFNEAEAEKVVEEILRRLQLFTSQQPSIGIVTLFRAQTEMIAQKLRKFQDILDIDVTIGTAHRFQGDEKDIIFFSPAVSDGVRTGTLHWIQTTNQLLNVAVTRARSFFVVIGDLDICRQTPGPLKNLSDHVETINFNNRKFDSCAKQTLYEELKKQGIQIIVNYQIKGASPFFIDFALFVNGNRYAIEIQREQKKIEMTQLLADGWKIRRFSEQDIHINLPLVMEEIKRLC